MDKSASKCVHKKKTAPAWNPIRFLDLLAFYLASLRLRCSIPLPFNSQDGKTRSGRPRRLGNQMGNSDKGEIALLSFCGRLC